MVPRDKFFLKTIKERKIHEKKVTFRNKKDGFYNEFAEQTIINEMEQNHERNGLFTNYEQQNEKS